MKNIGEKALKDFTLGTVKSVIKIVETKEYRCYIHLEDVHTNNACLYLSKFDEHSGGGRLVFGSVEILRDANSEVLENIYNIADKNYSKEDFTEKLFTYITENY